MAEAVDVLVEVRGPDKERVLCEGNIDIAVYSELGALWVVYCGGLGWGWGGGGEWGCG